MKTGMKLCIDCKHASNTNWGVSWMCMHPVFDSPPNPVDGYVDRGIKCSYARSPGFIFNPRPCGPKGKLWELAPVDPNRSLGPTGPSSGGCCGGSGGDGVVRIFDESGQIK